MKQMSPFVGRSD